MDLLISHQEYYLCHIKSCMMYNVPMGLTGLSIAQRARSPPRLSCRIFHGQHRKKVHSPLAHQKQVSSLSWSSCLAHRQSWRGDLMLCSHKVKL